VPLLLLKLTLTPLIVGGASLAARHWGAGVGGLIVALPLTSAPVIFFLALDQGPAFAAATATGTLVGLGILGGWSVAYVRACRRGPAAAVLAGTAVYAVLGLVVQPVLGLPFAVLVAGSLAGVTVGLRLMPTARAVRAEAPHPSWDLPARVIVGTVIVVTLTAIAPLLGAHVAGLLATYPVYVSVLAVFTQLHEGPDGAVDVVRGLLTGLFGTIAFWAVVQPGLTTVGVAPAFLAGIAVSLLIQAFALRSIRAGTAEAT
jgi:hypothetical protein